MSYIPPNIGIPLKNTEFCPEKLQQLKENLPKKLIIQVYGMAGVGKGTLSDQLSKVLDIPAIDTGKIWRAITYIYTNLNLEITEENTDKVFDLLQVGVENKQLAFYFENEKLEHQHLKNSFIDSKVAGFSKDTYAQEKFFARNLDIYTNVLKSAFVRDGRGAFPPDIRQAEEKGLQIIRILVDCSDEVKWQRYYQNVFLNKRANNFNIENTEEFKIKLYEEFKIHILERNKKDIIIQQELGNGLYSEDSGILDNGELNFEQTLNCALNFIAERVG